MGGGRFCFVGELGDTYLNSFYAFALPLTFKLPSARS